MIGDTAKTRRMKFWVREGAGSIATALNVFSVRNNIQNLKLNITTSLKVGWLAKYLHVASNFQFTDQQQVCA